MTVGRLEVEGASDILKLWEWQELNGTDSWISLGRGAPSLAVATGAGQGMERRKTNLHLQVAISFRPEPITDVIDGLR
jgi:hypothetical protein